MPAPLEIQKRGENLQGGVVELQGDLPNSPPHLLTQAREQAEAGNCIQPSRQDTSHQLPCLGEGHQSCNRYREHE